MAATAATAPTTAHSAHGGRTDGSPNGALESEAGKTVRATEVFAWAPVRRVQDAHIQS